MLSFTSIKFTNYKTFSNYSISLKDFNILVGPNNSGKSTIIGSFKILAEGIRKASSRKADIIEDPDGKEIYGYQLDIEDIPVATENAFHNYNDKEFAIAKFRLSNGSFLQVFFAPSGGCYMNCISDVAVIRSPKDFKKYFDVQVGFVPILGPVEHKEQLFQKEAARKALLTYTASRNFRNIWYHYQEDFEEFRKLLISTWPGMDINKPEVDYDGKSPIVYMFCPEERIPRELFWSGYGFQVWSQMLTYIIKNKSSSIFIIDEPDIYLHSDLQRQLIGILKSLGPDIIIATHSTELISEAEINDILIINKNQASAKRISNPAQLQEIFNILGSNLNPILTQVAKTKKVIFVEGKDFQIFSKFSRILGYDQVAIRSDFAVVPVEGFNPQKLRAFKEGIEKTIGGKINSAVIFDRDYRSDSEVEDELKDLSKGQDFVHIHSCKEIENFLINPIVIERATLERIKEKNKRSEMSIDFEFDIIQILEETSTRFRNKVFGQLQAKQFEYEKSVNPKLDQSTITENILKTFDTKWSNLEERIRIMPGKDFLASINELLQSKYGINISKANIISNFKKDDVPIEIVELITRIEEFRK